MSLPPRFALAAVLLALAACDAQAPDTTADEAGPAPATAGTAGTGPAPATPAEDANAEAAAAAAEAAASAAAAIDAASDPVQEAYDEGRADAEAELGD